MLSAQNFGLGYGPAREVESGVFANGRNQRPQNHVVVAGAKIPSADNFTVCQRQHNHLANNKGVAGCYFQVFG